MIYFIVDDLPLTLEHLVTCHIFPSELQLASILKQVWCGNYSLYDGHEACCIPRPSSVER
ncbi:hypothetical protein BDW75DRAFT_223823 [Aspergillus navahoensis]